MRPSSHSGAPTEGDAGTFDTETYDYTIDVRNSKVVYTLKRSFGIAYYFLGAKLPEAQTQLNVVVDEETHIDCVRNHDFVSELYKTDALVRQTDDLIDRELYPRSPTPVDRIEEVIDEYRAADRSLSSVADLWETELRLNTGEPSPETERGLLRRAVRHSCADFTELSSKIVDEHGTRLTDCDLQHARTYCEAFLACRDLVDDAFSLQDDTGTDEFNPFVTIKRDGLGSAVVTSLFEDLFESMTAAQSAVDDEDLRAYLEENTAYWRQKYESVVDSVTESYLVDEPYQQIVFRSR
jgi:hypothetical protein